MTNDNNNVFAGVAYPTAAAAEFACFFEYITAGGLNCDDEITDALDNAEDDADATAWMQAAGFAADNIGDLVDDFRADRINE